MDRTQPTQSQTVLPSVTAKKIARDVRRAYSLVIAYLGELEGAGWIRRRQRRHAPSQIELIAPPPDLSKFISSKFKVQSSKFRVQSSAMHSFPLSTNKDKYLHAAAANLNSELSGNELSEPSTQPDAQDGIGLDVETIAVSFEVAAQFHQRLTALLAEFGINGRRRNDLAQSIVELVRDHFSEERAAKILDDVRKGLEHARKKEAAGLADNAAMVGAAILEDYVYNGGQLVLFPIPGVDKKAKPRRTNARGFRRQQVEYTDEQREQAQEEARTQNAKVNADPAQLRVRLADYQSRLQRARDDKSRTYWQGMVEHTDRLLRELETQ